MLGVSFCGNSPTTAISIMGQEVGLCEGGFSQMQREPQTQSYIEELSFFVKANFYQPNLVLTISNVTPVHITLSLTCYWSRIIMEINIDYTRILHVKRAYEKQKVSLFPLSIAN